MAWHRKARKQALGRSGEGAWPWAACGAPRPHLGPGGTGGEAPLGNRSRVAIRASDGALSLALAVGDHVCRIAFSHPAVMSTSVVFPWLGIEVRVVDESKPLTHRPVVFPRPPVLQVRGRCSLLYVCIHTLPPLPFSTKTFAACHCEAIE